MSLNDVLTLIFSSGALLFSLLNFRRGRRFENENFLYKTKVEVSIQILGKLERLIRFLADNIEDAKLFLESPNEEGKEELNLAADEIDEACYEFNNFITGNSLVIPDKIVRMLSNFCDKILETDGLDSENDDLVGMIGIAENRIDGLLKDANQISIEIRKDLRIDELNSTLYRRIK